MGNGKMTYSVTGKMSTFGGPDDKGVGANEGLALCELKDIGKFPKLFLAEQPAGTTGLARRLDPQASYFACRFDYSKTPRSYLQSIEAKITAIKTALSFQARPIDWGPNENTGRVADLSPGLAKTLGIETGDEVTVEIPLPVEGSLTAPISETVSAPSAGYLHAMPQSTAAFDALYGKLIYKEGGGQRGEIVVDPEWVKENIVEADIPQLYKFTKNKSIQCHRLVAPHLIAVFSDIEKAGKTGLILSYDGDWVTRHKDWDPARGISLHSYGGAIDLNAEWNPYGHVPAPVETKGSCVELIPYFQARGFAWGGHFGGGHASDTDGMHFEWTGSAPVEIVSPTVTKGQPMTDTVAVVQSVPTSVAAPVAIGDLQAQLAVIEAKIAQIQAPVVMPLPTSLGTTIPSSQAPSIVLPPQLQSVASDLNAFFNLLVPVLSMVALFAPPPFGTAIATALPIIQRVLAALNGIQAAAQTNDPQAVQSTVQAHQNAIGQLWEQLKSDVPLLFGAGVK